MDDLWNGDWILDISLETIVSTDYLHAKTTVNATVQGQFVRHDPKSYYM